MSDAAAVPELPGAPWVLLLKLAVRVAFTSSALVALYYWLPMDKGEVSPVVLVLLAVVGLGALLTFQLFAVVRSPLPGLRAIEALAISLPLLILSYAAAYFLLSQDDPGAFNMVLDRTKALYLTITVFTTVGFGDIVPATNGVRLVVSSQMLVDLVFLGVGIRVIVGAVQLGRRRRLGARG